jgi:hypothetical protein
VFSGAVGTGTGRSPADAFTTISAAVAVCTADNGDVVLVLPGHVETVTGAAGVAIGVSGVTVRGIGNGHTRPKINLTTAIGASVDITAANVVFENFWINSGFDAITAMLNVTAADVTIRGCEFMVADATYQSVLGVLASGSGDRLVIEDCVFTGTTDTGTTSAISYGACDNVIIRRNIITGNHTTAGSIANTAAAVRGVIKDNTIINTTADGNNKAIVLHSSTDSIIAGNWIAVVDSTSPAPVTAAAGFVSGNYFTGAVGVSASTLL